MNQELEFRKQLDMLVSIARRQGMYLAEEQILETFLELSEQKDKINLIMEYLRGQKISIGEEAAMEVTLSDEDRNFLELYLEDIQAKEKVSPEEKREIILSAMAEDEDAGTRLLEIYLPDVAEIAKLYTGQGVYLEDLIGEGNVALISAVGMISCIEEADEADGFIGKFIMDAMEQYISGEAYVREQDERMLEKVNAVAKAAKELSEDLRRKVSIEELAKETDFTAEEIEEAMRASGYQIEDIEKKE